MPPPNVKIAPWSGDQPLMYIDVAPLESMGVILAGDERKRRLHIAHDFAPAPGQPLQQATFVAWTDAGDAAELRPRVQAMELVVRSPNDGAVTSMPVSASQGRGLYAAMAREVRAHAAHRRTVATARRTSKFYMPGERLFGRPHAATVTTLEFPLP